jgi:hypothetical protein
MVSILNDVVSVMETYRREVSRTNTVDSDAQIPPCKFSSLHLAKQDSSSLGSIIIELTPLRSLCDSRHGREVDDVSWFGVVSY